MAKRCCADDANLCEIVEINAGKDKEQFEGVLGILKKNRFDTMYRKQLERMSANGTVGGYIRLENADLMSDGTVKGGTIRINYVFADSIIPLTIINDEVTECAFAGEDVVNGKKQGTLVVFRREKGLYAAYSYFFDEDYKHVTGNDKRLQLGEVCPFFLMRTAEVNNLDDMEGYGYPKVYSSIPVLETLDLAYNILYSDLDKGEKLVFINEMLAVIQRDANNMPTLTPAQKKIFVLLGDQLGKNSDEESLVKEYNPEIRIDAITKIFETCLSLLSMTFGYGTKKYTFENGQIKTATEYVGEKQDCMQELNKQRYEAKQYIAGICNAIIWFSNQFHGTAWNQEEEICVEFDDSYITDKQTQMESMRADAISFPDVPEFKIQYIMFRMNCDREEALTYIQIEPEEKDENED